MNIYIYIYIYEYSQFCCYDLREDISAIQMMFRAWLISANTCCSWARSHFPKRTEAQLERKVGFVPNIVVRRMALGLSCKEIATSSWSFLELFARSFSNIFGPESGTAKHAGSTFI